jgi:hypothetical protein
VDTQPNRGTLEVVRRENAANESSRSTCIIAICASTWLSVLVALGEPSDACAAERAIVFVEMDGADLELDDYDDAASDRTSIPQLAGTLAPFSGSAAQRAAILQSVREDWQRYAVDVVDVRPGDPSYVMAVVTPGRPLGAGIDGAAVLDCDDARGPGEIVFAFEGEVGETSELAIAATISQEVAHAFGLEHVDDAVDLLFPVATSVDASFVDECLALTEGFRCSEVHDHWCEPGRQNSHAELLDQLGSATPDTGPPEVEIVTPSDGDVVAVGSDVSIVVAASDDTRVEHVTVYESDREVGVDTTAPFEFTITAIPAGDYAIRVVATDIEGHEAHSDSILVSAVGPSSGLGPALPRGTEPAGCAIGRTPGWGLLALLACVRRRRDQS